MIRVTLDTKECMPHKAHRWDAGYDLRSNEQDFILKRFEKYKVHTGVRIQIPVRHMGMIVPRSGLGTKQNITLTNGTGVIDSEYRGELVVNLINEGDEDYEIKRYNRIAQLVIVPVYITELQAVGALSKTKREDKGFGSSGVE